MKCILARGSKRLAMLAFMLQLTSHAAGSEPSPKVSRDWSVLAGVAVITNGDIGDILAGEFDRAEGDAGGELYLLTVSWTAHRFEIPYGDRLLRPQFEPYLTLTFVDENKDSIFPDYNAGVGFSWVDFPWN
jgi:hypothetical protein